MIYSLRVTGAGSSPHPIYQIEGAHQKYSTRVSLEKYSGSCTNEPTNYKFIEYAPAFCNLLHRHVRTCWLSRIVAAALDQHWITVIWSQWPHAVKRFEKLAALLNYRIFTLHTYVGT